MAPVEDVELLPELPPVAVIRRRLAQRTTEQILLRQMLRLAIAREKAQIRLDEQARELAKEGAHRATA